MNNIFVEEFIFQNGVTSATSNGTEFVVPSGVSSMNIEIQSAGAFSAIFEACVYTANYKPYVACKFPSLDLISTTTDATSIYQVDLTGIKSFRVRLEAVTGATSVYGRCIA